MSLLATLSSFLTVTLVISLMGKKRATPDEAGPSRGTRSKGKPPEQARRGRDRRFNIPGVDKEGPILEKRSKRRHDPCTLPEQVVPPGIEFGRFKDRKIVFEANVDNNMFGTYILLDRIVENGWGTMFEATEEASENLVRAFYARILEAKIKPLGFKVSINRKMYNIGVKEIATALGMELGKVHIKESNLREKGPRDERAISLCGKLVNWRRGTSIKAKHLAIDYHLLHYICTYNVYPRSSNRSEVSRFMVEFLYQMGQEANLCIPTLVLKQIVKAVLGKREKLPLPFGRLICKLARQYEFKYPVGVPYPIMVINEDTINRFKRNSNQLQGSVEESGDEEDEEGEEEEDGEDNDEDIDEDYVAPPLIHERFSRVEEELSSVRSELTNMRAEMKAQKTEQEQWNQKIFRTLKEVLCCVQMDGAAPHPTDSQDH